MINKYWPSNFDLRILIVITFVKLRMRNYLLQIFINQVFKVFLT